MKAVRKCDNCAKLNKKRKTNPCELGFNSIYDKENKVFVRPNKCKKKIEKENPKKELKKVKERAIDAFQKWVRYRDNFTCVVCGFHIDKNDKEATKLIHGGHYISRTINNLLLDPKNCHAQCRNCNFLQDKLGINPKYTLYLFDKYGREVFQYFFEKIIGNQTKVYDYDYWKNQMEYWEEKLKEIKKDC